MEKTENRYYNPLEINRLALILSISNELPESVEMPLWAQNVKTSHSKENLPTQKNWWRNRASSMLVKLFARDGQEFGVGKIRRMYPSPKNRGTRPKRSFPASGKVIRVILHQFEKVGFVSIGSGGRKLTAEAKSFINRVFKGLMGL